MPKRSNAFQQVVKLLHDQFSGHAVITESAFLKDVRTGTPREVDIVIEGSIAEYDLVMSIECVDHLRRASVEWVDRMSGKHADLPTNKLVLVSRSGFSTEAQAKAKALGITTLSLGKVASADWSKIAGKLDNMSLELLNSRYETLFAIETSTGFELRPAYRNTVLFNGNRSTYIPLSLLVDELLKLPEIGAIFLDYMGKEKQEEHTFSIVHKFLDQMMFEDKNRQVVFVRDVHLNISCSRSHAAVPLLHGEMRGAKVAFGERETASGQLAVAVVERENQDLACVVRQLEAGQWREIVNAAKQTSGLQLTVPTERGV